jgi:phosphotransacetylase
MQSRPHLARLVERVRLLPPLAAALVYPVEADALQLALSGVFAGYLAPTLVGPEARIRDVANRSGLDVSRLAIADTPDDPRAAAASAVAMAREGKVAALVKGSLAREQLLSPVAAPESGLRTATRLSHAAVLDLPGIDRPLVVTDAELNVAPTLAAKRDVLQNALGLARVIGVAAPRVALLAAVDGPARAFPSTTDAVALKSMGAHGLFGNAIIEGPLTPDRALPRVASRGAAPADPADVMLAPSMEAAVMLLRTLTALTQGLAAGIVLGARVPVVLPARGEAFEAGMAACVLAALMAADGGRTTTATMPDPGPGPAAIAA